MPDIRLIIVGVGTIVFIGLYTYINLLKTNIELLQNRLNGQVATSLIRQSETVSCKAVLNEQTAAIKFLNEENLKSANELQIWKEKPPSKRYEVIYRDINISNIKTEDCNEIKSNLNSLGNIKYSDL